MFILPKPDFERLDIVALNELPSAVANEGGRRRGDGKKLPYPRPKTMKGVGRNLNRNREKSGAAKKNQCCEQSSEPPLDTNAQTPDVALARETRRRKWNWIRQNATATAIGLLP